MKKQAVVILALALTAALLYSGASANSWGLSGDLYRAVEQSKAWDDYTCVGSQAGDFAVMGTRYHNALFYVDNGYELHAYTTAVYQPEDGKPAPKLTVSDDFDLTISYGENESYTFAYTLDGYELTEATAGSFRLSVIPVDDSVFDWHFSAEDGEETAVFPVNVMLDNFNIRLFPRSAAEVRNINRMHALLGDTRYCLGFGSPMLDPYSPDRPGTLLEPKQKGTVPVYSAPSVKSWRAGKGKAAVGTNGKLWVLAHSTGEDGRAYACLRYNVSERTQRIGWALCKDLGLPEETEDTCLVRTRAETAANTFLTDDPDVSQYAQFALPKGTQLTCLGLYNEDYAYAEVLEKNGKISGKGTVVRGFVPVRDLQPATGKVQAGIMKKAAGAWYAEGGGRGAGDLFILNADGTFASGYGGGPDEEAETLEGTWYVAAYDPAEGLYWDEPAYRITLLYENGNADIYGMSLTDTHLNLTTNEGGTNYARYDGTDEYDEDGEETEEE